MTLKYVGRAPDSDNSVLDTKYVKDRYNTIKVDPAYIGEQVASQSTALVNQAYVDQQDALRARKTDVDAADALYVPTSNVGVNGGLVPLNGSALIDPSRLGTVQTDRKAFYVPGTQIISVDRNVQTVSIKDFRAGTLTVADPGFPYYPLIIAQMRGGSAFGTATNRGMGTGSFGQLSVLRASDDVKFSWCLTTAHKTIGPHTAIPFGDNNTTPASRICTGANTFDLWLGLFSGSTYSFSPSGFNYYAMVFPAFS